VLAGLVILLLPARPQKAPEPGQPSALRVTVTAVQTAFLSALAVSPGLLFASRIILILIRCFYPGASGAREKTCAWVDAWPGRGQADKNLLQIAGRLYSEGHRSVA